MTSTTATTIPRTPEQWRAALDELPTTPDKIPAFFFGHGSPMLQWPEGVPSRGLDESMGPKGPLAQFLQDFGPHLLQKYKPKGILVFSAHWETTKERLVTDYGDSQPLLMDYYGFNRELYELKFDSNGSSELSKRVVEAFKQFGMPARTTEKTEARGRDGRGYNGPGLDHGVFVPFRLMFGHTFHDIPIVEASIESDLSPESNWEVGKAVSKLREEGILILSGGLTIHTFEDFGAFSESTAKPIFKDFDKTLLHAVTDSSVESLKSNLTNVTKHAGFRKAHPREEHFIPLYVAAGAGEGGQAKVVSGIREFALPTRCAFHKTQNQLVFDSCSVEFSQIYVDCRSMVDPKVAKFWQENSSYL